MTKPTAIDLFSGCGGLTLGLKWAGFRVIGAVEIEPVSIETYRTNHNSVRIWGQDIKSLSARRVKRDLNIHAGDLDLLAGCPPCQGFSSLRTLNGSKRIKDSRNDLVLEFLRFIRELKPKAVMMENVPGLVNDQLLKVFCREIRSLGYSYEYRVLDAADYGVPQRRKRMILLAGRFGYIEFATSEHKRQTFGDAVGFLPPAGRSGDLLHDLPERRNNRVKQLINRIPRNGGSRASLDRALQLACHRKCDGFKDVYGRMSWTDVSPTITSGCVNPSKGRFLHPIQDRSITLREAALLQSFPQEYFFSLRRGKHHTATLIGNALPPEFVRKHANEVKKYLKTLN